MRWQATAWMKSKFRRSCASRRIESGCSHRAVR